MSPGHQAPVHPERAPVVVAVAVAVPDDHEAVATTAQQGIARLATPKPAARRRRSDTPPPLPRPPSRSRGIRYATPPPPRATEGGVAVIPKTASEIMAMRRLRANIVALERGASPAAGQPCVTLFGQESPAPPPPPPLPPMDSDDRVTQLEVEIGSLGFRLARLEAKCAEGEDLQARRDTALAEALRSLAASVLAGKQQAPIEIVS